LVLNGVVLTGISVSVLSEACDAVLVVHRDGITRVDPEVVLVEVVSLPFGLIYRPVRLEPFVAQI